MTDQETVSNSDEREKMLQRTNLETQTKIFAPGFLGAALFRSLLVRSCFATFFHLPHNDPEETSKISSS